MEENKEKIRIVITTILLILIFIIKKIIYIDGYKDTILYFIPFIIIGYEIFIDAFYGIKNGEPFDECFLMSVASIGAFIMGEYTEAVAVLLLYQIGEQFEDYAVDKSEDSIEELTNIAPKKSYIFKNGEVVDIDSSLVEIGDILIIKNGDKIPIDGIVIEGETELDTKALTGESIPRTVKENDMVLSGSINLSQTIKIKTIKKFQDSTASKIIDLVKNATDKKSKSEKFIRSFAKVYTPIVCFIALLVFTLPVLTNLIMMRDLDYITWGYRALTILVISCPCSLVVSIPIAFFASVGKASKKGILIKGTNYIEALSKINTLIVDKTGTMTKGVFEVVAVHNEDGIEKEDILRYAAYVENYSNHPIAKCIKKEYKKHIDESKINNCKEIGGYGLSAYVDEKYVLVGSYKLMIENNISCKPCELNGTEVHVAINNKYYGHILISDVIRDEAKETIDTIKEKYISNIIMLTGDEKKVASHVAEEIGIKEYYSSLLPQDKLNFIEEKYKNEKSINIAFVGDGINDAPCLVRSNVGISMGNIGTDSAIEASDVVLIDDNLKKIPMALNIARKNMIVVYEIIFLSLFVKIAILILAIFGISNMWLAIFADVGMLIICILNALRLLI